jgi:xanthine dehydrogenase accessory factor
MSSMSDAFDKIPEVLRSQAGVILATVIGTSGSTPASALARMLVGETGERLAGTIGGGCVEGDVISAARAMAGSGKSAVMTFTLDEDHLESGMLCGGTLDVFIEPVSRNDLVYIESLRDRRDAGDDSIRGTLLGNDGAILGRFLIPPGLPAGPAADIPAGVLQSFLPQREALMEAVEEISRRGVVARIPVGEGRLILELVAGAPSLFLFGGGHVSRSVSKIAAMAGFRVTVIDDRPEFANPERFPEAARTIAADFIESFTNITVKPSSSIVIVTRGHKADEMVLGVAATTPAGYIGMIGSRKKVAATFERLISRGVPADALRRVRTPIGLEIGAVTPEEIAVSIVAELIHARRAPLAPLGFKSDRTTM